MAFSIPDEDRSAKGIILDECLTAETAAALTGYNIQHVRRLAFDGNLEALRVGRACQKGSAGSAIWAMLASINSIRLAWEPVRAANHVANLVLLRT